MKFLIVKVYVTCGQTDRYDATDSCVEHLILFVDIINSSLVQRNFTISVNILSTNFSVLNDPSMLLYRLYWYSVTPWRWERSQYVGLVKIVCEIYKFNITVFVGFVVWIAYESTEINSFKISHILWWRSH
jgi:hypothetical protein